METHNPLKTLAKVTFNATGGSYSAVVWNEEVPFGTLIAINKQWGRNLTEEEVSMMLNAETAKEIREYFKSNL